MDLPCVLVLISHWQTWRFPLAGPFMGFKIFNVFFPGVSGTVQLDSNGDRIGDYWLWDMKETENVYQKWAEVRMSDKEADLPVCIFS